MRFEERQSKTGIRSICLIVFFCISTFARANSDVRVSILGLLAPAEIHLTLISVRGSLNVATRQFPLHAGDTVQIRIRNGSLNLQSQNLNVDHAEMRCPEGCRFQIEVPGKLTRLYEGDLNLSPVNSTINIVLILPLEELVDSVTASEMSAFHEPEVWKAFAVLARTYLKAGPRHPDLEADACDTTHCQVFQGYKPEPALAEAVADTQGLVLRYRKLLFRPFYSRSCGGKTATYEEVWHAGSPDYPFFPVDCPYCVNSAEARWTSRLTAEQLAQATGISKPALDMTADSVRVSGTRYSLEDFRILLGRVFGWKTLPSNDYNFGKDGADYVFTGRGAGHRVGLCQNGAAFLARQGKNFRQILSYYFPNTEIRE